MDSNSHRSQTKTASASRLARMGYSVIESEEQQIRPTIPHLSLDHISPSPKKVTTPTSPSTHSLPLQELLLLSPGSPLRRSRTRLADRIEMAAEDAAVEQGGSRRRCKSRSAQMGNLGCGSPRNNRRSRRRMEMELRDDNRDLVLAEEMGKPRKRRHSGKSKKEKLSLVPSLPSSSSRNAFKMREEDFLRLARLILPAINFAISKMTQLFSGEPSMTLKVAECMKQWVIEAWGACSHKKVVAASAGTAFWNLSSVKTRIFTAFITLVIIRYYRQQHLVQKSDEVVEKEQQLEQALVVVAGEGE
ncbi:Reticulon [Corchorus olitorius]|uniref:Reticulon n=1 Tax=Corchorus olitorius TaxID=93759 RepID=A0A1R3HFW9_9ROSI|nr:Reticulon [Corchorus olitorius]